MGTTDDLGDGPVLIDGTQDPLIGRNLVERYAIESKLGEGGMGSVYLARHLVLDKRLALKVLHPELARKPDLVERFLNEAKSASRIRHENVIDITDFGTSPDGATVFFAMELLSGRDLQEEMVASARQGSRLPWPRSRAIFLQVCAALTAAHRVGILHRDLKPENIYLVEWLGHQDFVKLLDFGIAKSTEVPEEARKLTRTGMLFGTPEYMSPEQARGEKPDLRVDIYAMGCILYQLISGRVPFEADSFMAVLSKQLSEEPPPLDESLAEVGAPPELAEVVAIAMAKDKEERYASMEELAGAVRAADDAPRMRRGSQSPPLADRSRARTRRRWPVVLAAGVLIAAAAVTGVVVATGGGGDPASPAAVPAAAADAGAATTGQASPAIDAGSVDDVDVRVPGSPRRGSGRTPGRGERTSRPIPPVPPPSTGEPEPEIKSPPPPPEPAAEDEPAIGDVKPKDPFGGGSP